MSHYREINKELVDQVQKMRKDIKLFQDEIIRLKRELVEKHESEVLLRKQCYKLAVNNFVQLLQTMQPDSEILPVLKEHIQSQERLSSNLSSNDRRVSFKSGTSSERTRRSSSSLTMELIRCNMVTNLRQSLRNTSPIRKSSKGSCVDDQEVGRDSQLVQQDTENVECTENELLQTESFPQPLTSPIVDNIIYEESDEEERLCDESMYESVEEVDTSEIRSTLKDVTNILTATINTTKPESCLIKTLEDTERSKKIKKQDLSDHENNTTSMELCSDSDIKKNTTKNITKRRTKLTVIDIDEETLPQLRRFTTDRDSSGTNRSFPVKQSNNHTHNEVSINSPNSVYHDMTLRNFKSVACSTPNSLRNSQFNDTPPHAKTVSVTDVGSSDFVISTNTSARPSRRCKPKCLAEPNIATKLRNESTTKPKRRTKSKSKKKK